VTRLVRAFNAKPWTWALLFLAGVAFHLAAEAWWKGLLVMAGAILLDIVVDVAFTKAEEKAGEID
jgi:ABC-type transport system involved in cytochrome bd biosynthesis fused ATPase/permease subunit